MPGCTTVERTIEADFVILSIRLRTHLLEHVEHVFNSAVDQFKRQFAHLEEHYQKNGNNSVPQALERQHASLPRYVRLPRLGHL